MEYRTIGFALFTLVLMLGGLIGFVNSSGCVGTLVYFVVGIVGFVTSILTLRIFIDELVNIIANMVKSGP